MPPTPRALALCLTALMAAPTQAQSAGTPAEPPGVAGMPAGDATQWRQATASAFGAPAQVPSPAPTQTGSPSPSNRLPRSHHRRNVLIVAGIVLVGFVIFAAAQLHRS